MVIYKIVNHINNKVYVGQTTRSLKKRWRRHLSDVNKLDYPIYKAMRKHGVENFSVEEIDRAKDSLNNTTLFEWELNTILWIYI